MSRATEERATIAEDRELARVVELMEQVVARRAQSAKIKEIAEELFPDADPQSGRSQVWELLQTHRRQVKEERPRQPR
jgi:hypothetical protein